MKHGTSSLPQVKTPELSLRFVPDILEFLHLSDEISDGLQLRISIAMLVISMAACLLSIQPVPPRVEILYGLKITR